MDPINVPLNYLNWQLLSPWTKTVQVIKYWFGYWLYTGIRGNVPNESTPDRHLSYIANEQNKYNTTGESYIHNQWGDLNAYSSVCKEVAERGENPKVPWKDLVGSWLIWVVLFLVIFKLLQSKK